MWRAVRCLPVLLSGRSFRGPRTAVARPLAAEEYWTATDDIPGWDVDLDGDFLIRVIVNGVPPLRVELTIGNVPIDLPGVAGGQLAVAMTAVRAIPYVLDAPPGVVTAPVFGTYRWPDATS